MTKLKAGITGFRMDVSPWEQFEILRRIGYRTSENAVMQLMRMEGDLDENIARYKEMGMELYAVGVQKPFNPNFFRRGGKIEDMCTIRPGYLDMSFDYLTTDDKVIEDTIACAEKLGVKLISNYSGPALNSRFGLTPCEKDVWFEYLEASDKIAEKFEKAGLHYFYHNHSEEFSIKYDGVSMFDYLLERTSGLSVELDIGWALFGGADPVEVLKKAHDRVVSLHIKDYVDGTVPDPGTPHFQMPRFTTVGTGKVDIDSFLGLASELGYEYAIVEQDVLRNLDTVETLTASYLNMKETGFVE